MNYTVFFTLLILSGVQLYRRRTSEQFFVVLAATLSLLTVVGTAELGYNYYDNLSITKLFNKVMRVPSHNYFTQVEPVIYSFCIAIILFQFVWGASHRHLDAIRRRISDLSGHNHTKFLILFAVLLFIIPPVARIMPSSFSFIFHLVGVLKYGLIWVYSRKFQSPVLKFLIISAYPLFLMVQGGMFQAYFGLILAILILTGDLKKGKLFVIGGLVVLPFMFGLIQQKNRLRSYARSNDLSVGLFYSTIKEELGGRRLLDAETFVGESSFELYRRLNQGFLVSAVLEKSDERGEKVPIIFETLKASIVPRFLWPEKPRAGGKEKIERFTALNLTAGTSMNISPFGEILVEFEGARAIVVAFLYGIFLCAGIRLFIILSAQGSISFLIIPFVLSQMYKVETDMLTVLNLLTKSLIFGYLFLRVESRIFHQEKKA